MIKTKQIMPLFLILALSFISCFDEKEGDWNDNIKLSKKEIIVSKDKNSIKITTEGKWWWIYEMKLNGESIDFDNEITSLKDFVIEKDIFRIERKNAQEIDIDINENKTNKKRVLEIGIQAGNYFDRIKLTQEK